MTEIDKLVNQAFPEELRKVTPISVDEEKVAALTFQKLGLERPAAAAKETEKTWQGGRYAMRHGRRKPEPQPELVAVPIEPARPVWRTLASWAAAACLLAGCVLWFGPALLRSLPWEDARSGADGVNAGGALLAREGIAEPEAGEGVLAEGGTEAAGGAETAQRPVGAMDSLNGMMQGADSITLSGKSAFGDVRILEATPIDWQDQITITIAFPGFPASEISKFNIELRAETWSHVAARENFESGAQVTFQLNALEDRDDLVCEVLVQQEGEWGINPMWGYNLYFDLENGGVPTVFEFSEDQYAQYGYLKDNDADNWADSGGTETNGSVNGFDADE